MNNSLDDIDDDELEDLYASVLDHLLFPAAVKAELIKSQSKEKKKQMVIMHRSAIEKDKLVSWGEKENSILTILMKSRMPDLKQLSYIKTVLTTANKAVLSSFIEASGVTVFVKCINERVARANVTELDAVVLYELVSCLKVTMNNETGMLAVLETPDAINALARCLIFEWKSLSTIVLEILSCCCYYSEAAAKAVIEALRQWSVTRGERTFAGLVSVFEMEDLSIRYDVMSLINQMIMAVDDVVRRSILRDEFLRLLLVDKVKNSIETAEREINEYEISNSTRKDLPSIVGSRAFESKISSQISNSSSNTAASIGAMTIKKLTEATTSDVKQGCMVGFCITNTQQSGKSVVAESMSYLGFNTKKTKRRWCILEGDTFQYSMEKDTDTTAGTIHLSTVTDIRNFTTDQSMSKLSNFCWEVETGDKVLVLGSETQIERDNWVSAFRVAKDKAVISSSEFRNKMIALNIEDAKEYLQQLKKNLSLFESIWVEDRKYTMTPDGLDTGNYSDMFRFVQLQAMAGNTEAKLHELLYQLVILPPGMDVMFEAIINSARKYRGVIDGNLSSEVSETDGSVKSTAASSAAYQQMSKLALLVITAENEVKSLRQKSNTTRRMSVSTGMRKSFVDLSKDAISNLVDNNDSKTSKLTENESVSDIADSHSNADKSQGMPNNAETINSNEMSSQSSQHIKSLDDPSSAGKMSPGESIVDPRYAKFIKMKSSAPVAVVRDNMSSEGFTLAEIDYFFSPYFVVPMLSTTSNAADDVPISTNAANIDNPNPIPSDPRFEKYIKMRRMLPEGAVRQKMTVEGFTVAEIDAFFSNAPTATPPAVTTQVSSGQIDSRYEKFIKMRRMLPEGAVRQKMAVEGFSPAEIDAFFNDSTGATPSPVIDDQPQAPIDPRYEKFNKMRRMLPEGAVRQKMAVEGFTAPEIDAFFNGATVSSAVSAASVESSITSDPIFAKYSKMRTMLPEGAVRQKMIADGISPENVDRFFGATTSTAAASIPTKAAVTVPPKPPSNLPPSGFTPKPVMQPKKKLKALFWNKISNDTVGNTVWKHVHDFSLSPNEINDVEEWFASSNAVTKKGGDMILGDEASANASVRSTSPAAKEKSISLLDSKKMQNVLIAMGKLRMPAPKIAECIITMNEATLTQEMTETLIDIGPTAEEINQHRSYEGKVENLDRASVFYWHICKIPRLQIRLECHAMIFRWFGDADELVTRYNAILAACREVKQNEGLLLKLLSIILAIGNYMNGGSSRGQAYGVRLEVLKKLAAIKADGADRGSIVHFVANLASQRAPELLSLADSWTALWATGEITLRDLERDLKRINSLVDKARSELKNGIPIVLSEGGENMAQPLKKRLERFVSLAEPRLKEISSLKSETEAGVIAMSQSFGESGDLTGEDDPGLVIFEPILSFAKSFKQALDEIAQQKKKAEKAAIPSRIRRGTTVGGMNESMANIIAQEAKKKVSDNLFANFNNAKSASAETLVAQFKQKQRKKSVLAEEST